MEKKELKSTILFANQKRKINNLILKKNPSDTKHSPSSNVYYMEFYRNVVIEYSLIGIVKLKSTRRKEI